MVKIYTSILAKERIKNKELIKARTIKHKIKVRYMYQEEQLRIRKDKIDISFFIRVLYPYSLISPASWGANMMR